MAGSKYKISAYLIKIKFYKDNVKSKTTF